MFQSIQTTINYIYPPNNLETSIVRLKWNHLSKYHSKLATKWHISFRRKKKPNKVSTKLTVEKKWTNSLPVTYIVYIASDTDAYTLHYHNQIHCIKYIYTKHRGAHRMNILAKHSHHSTVSHSFTDVDQARDLFHFNFSIRFGFEACLLSNIRRIKSHPIRFVSFMNLITNFRFGSI